MLVVVLEAVTDGLANIYSFKKKKQQQQQQTLLVCSHILLLSTISTLSYWY